MEISPRIQHLVVRSFPYQPFNIRYWKGVEIPLADTLNRVTPLPMEEDGIQLPIIAVNQVTVNIPYSSNRWDQIHEETRKDPTLKLLMHYIPNGWPCEWRQLPQELHVYWNYQEDLSLKDGIATKGSRVLIPSTLWRKALEEIHDGHQGVEKCMLKARESVFWPGISDVICEAVEKCGICQSSSKAAKLIGNISEVVPHAWLTLGTDLFYWNRIDFLMIGDYFTKFLIVRKLLNSSTHVVIKELGMVFTEFGQPFMLKSDNGPWYSCREFQQFLHFYQVHHITISPHHPQSNGFAEALVGMSKKMMEKSIKDGKPWSYGLLQYCVTPISNMIPSPLKALTGRKLRTSLPQIPLSIGKSVESSRICQELIKRQPTHTSTTYKMELELGQPVFIKEVHGNIWKTGTIDQPAKEPDSYWVRFPDNFILRTIWQIIKPRSTHFELESELQERNNTQFIPSDMSSSFWSMLPGPKQPALPTSSAVTPQLSESGTSSMRQDIPTSSWGVTQPSIPAVRRSARCTKGVPPRRYSPSRVQTVQNLQSVLKC